MWESPVNIFEIHEPIAEEINKQTEETVFKAIHRVGVDVNKEELLKALQYDRNQYEKGYKDGYDEAIDEFAEKFIFKAVCEGCSGCTNCYEEEAQNICDDWKYYMEIAEQMKGSEENE